MPTAGRLDSAIRIALFITLLMAANLVPTRAVGIEPDPADLVLRRGKIVTMESGAPLVEALAARSGRIQAVGGESQVSKYIGPNTHVINLEGKLAIPGFIEGHGHFVSLGRARMNLNLVGVQNWDEIVDLVAQAAKRQAPGTWIVGRGWHQEKWDERPTPHVDGYPTHAALSGVSPIHPVLLTHASGHMCFANAMAMKLAGVADATPDPRGGQILRDASGRLTGVFRESAQSPIRRVHAQALRNRTAAQRRADWLQAVDLATTECLSKGVTSFQDAGSSFETIDSFRQLAADGRLKLRLWVMVRDSRQRMRNHLADYRMIGSEFLTVRGIKQMVDGALGSHGAWLLQPYHDLPSSSGLNVESIESIRETALLAIKYDYQLCVHAIGDRANREILDLFQSIFRSFPNKHDLRWRIEHAQHIHPDDIPRFAELGVIASMQGNHCISDAPFVVERLGPDRAKYGAYAWRSLIDSGATVINGTDTPVEDVDPIQSYYASVARRTAGGSYFFPEQRMSRTEALASYTIKAAAAAFEEADKGSLSPGKLADIVVLSQDILTVPETDIPQTKVNYTIVGGRVAYQMNH